MSRSVLALTGLLLTLPGQPESGRPLVIAHRGGMALRPENTMAAFRHAVEIGAEVLELDMNVTADDRIVIHHDTAINPEVCVPEPASAVVPAAIRRLTLRQVLSFDCGSRRPPRFPDQQLSPGARIPTLDELLTAFGDTRIEFLGETKMAPDGSAGFVKPQRFIELVDHLIRKYGVSGRFILQSGDYRTLDEMRERNSAVRLCLLNVRRFKPDYQKVAGQHGATHLMLNAADVTKEGMIRLRAAGLRVFSSTANDTAAWRAYLDLNMDGILTDDPEGLLRYLKTAR